MKDNIGYHRQRTTNRSWTWSPNFIRKRETATMAKYLLRTPSTRRRHRSHVGQRTSNQEYARTESRRRTRHRRSGPPDPCPSRGTLGRLGITWEKRSPGNGPIRLGVLTVGRWTELSLPKFCETKGCKKTSTSSEWVDAWIVCCDCFGTIICIMCCTITYIVKRSQASSEKAFRILIRKLPCFFIRERLSFFMRKRLSFFKKAFWASLRRFLSFPKLSVD